MRDEPRAFVRLRALVAACLLALSLPLPATAAAPEFGFEVVAFHPHDRRVWTQGLLHDGAGDIMWVSGGRYGRSTLRRVELASGRVLAERRLPKPLFAEGIARVGDEIFQLTWQEQVAVVYDAATLEPRREFRYDGEGWGLTTLGDELVFSNGSSELSFRRPSDFAVLRRVEVRDGDTLVAGLNELEAIGGAIFANVHPTPRIARISPRTGAVTGWLDLSELVRQVEQRGGAKVNVVNGIAYDPARRRVFVTGKYWPAIVEIRSPIFVPSD